MTPMNYDLTGTAVPWWLVISCRNRWYLRNWVELGAGYGHQSAIAAEHFRHVHAVELVPEVFEHQVPELQRAANATRYCGSTVDLLPQILSQIDGPTFWYIDSHWPGLGPKLGPECPLLDELIRLQWRAGAGDVVMIDNAGMFFDPPMPPQDPAQWPRSSEVWEHLRQVTPRVQFFADVMIGTPEPLWGSL